jgi:hypothetical protein
VLDIFIATDLARALVSTLSVDVATVKGPNDELAAV